ncbi:MAG: tetratricopeptide repeat protein [Gammaproteobacteria bacterium]|nr:tetratricopeptide repeat protein [Gammaproteobacteria bacterium]MDH5799825.1 tetratricopeptide repeat protein [Gammaproteobacteria bacterium]
MNFTQILLAIIGSVLLVTGIYFHSKDKKSGSFIGLGSALIVLAAFSPVLVGMMPGLSLRSSDTALAPAAQELSVQHTQSVHTATTPAQTIQTPVVETTTVEPVAVISEKAKGYAKSVSSPVNQDLSAADLLLLGTQAWQDKDYSMAFSYVNQGLSMKPEARVHSSLVLLLGSLYETIGNRKAAEENYRLAATLDASYNWPHIKLGNLFTALKRYGDAESAYTKAIELDPEDGWTYNNLGILYSGLKRYGDAEKAYRSAIRLNPSDAWAHNNLGVLYKDLQRYDEAEQAYTKAVVLEPSHRLAKNNLAVLQRIKKQEPTKQSH